MTALKWIEIDNFRGISHIRYEPKQVNLIIGRNNSGKSTLLDAIYSNLSGRFEDASKNYEGFYRRYDVKIGNKVSHINSDIHTLTLYGADAKVPEDIFEYIESRLYEALNKIYDKIKLPKDTIASAHRFVLDNYLISVSVYDGEVFIYIDTEDNSVYQSEINEKLIDVIYNSNNSQAVAESSSEYRNYYRYDIIALINDYIYKGSIMPRPDDVVRIDDIKKNLGKFFEDDVKLREIEDIIKEYNLIPNLDRLTSKGVMYKSNSGELSFLPYLIHGDGFFSLLMMISEIKNAKDGILLIEEPENHMHPGYLSVFAEQLMTLSEKLNVQVFMTSHSYDLIDEFARYPMNEKESDMIQITNIVKYKDEHEIYNRSPSEALNIMDKLLIDLRGT